MGRLGGFLEGRFGILHRNFVEGVSFGLSLGHGSIRNSCFLGRGIPQVSKHELLLGDFYSLLVCVGILLGAELFGVW